MSELINIEKKDEVYCKISSSKSIEREIYDHFKFEVPNCQFMPAYKNGTWDGQIKLFSLRTKLFYIGLISQLIEFSNERKYKVVISKNTLIHNENAKIETENFFRPLTFYSKGKQIFPRDYQIIGTENCIRYEKCLIISPTGSGKSLIIYSIIRYFEEDCNKILLIVPTINLVEQMFKDFSNYSSEDESWDIESKCHKITAGKSKVSDIICYISTWQSMHRMSADYLQQFSMVICDEVHLATGNSIQKIMTKTINAKYRFGLTGSLQEPKCDKLVLEGLFGPPHAAVTTRELMDRKSLSNLFINCLHLKYSEAESKTLKKLTYNEEIEYIIGHKKRNNFIKRLALDILKKGKGNVLILFQRIEDHGKILLELLQGHLELNKDIFFIYGGTKTVDREIVRKIAEEKNNIVILASYGVFSTGMDIQNLQHLILASFYKSMIKNIQSIGRILRLDNKDNECTLYDIVDDFSHKTHKNYALLHFLHRIGIYSNQDFDYKITKINF